MSNWPPLSTQSRLMWGLVWSCLALGHCGGLLGADDSAGDGATVDAPSPSDGAIEDGPSDAGLDEAADGSGTDGAQDAGEISTVAFCGTEPEQVVIDSTDLYWTNQDSTVMKCSLGGCGGKPTYVASGTQGQPAGIALSPTTVYWASQDNAAMTGILQCAKTGCGQTPSQFAPSPMPVGVATADNAVFWTDAQDQSVFRCSASGCVTPTVIASAQKGAAALVADSSNVYWIDDVGNGLSAGNQILKCPNIGCAGQPTILAASQNGPTALALDSSNLYWTNAGDGTILKCAIAGCSGAPTKIASGQGTPLGLATDGVALYWSDQAGGRILTCSVGGCGTPELLALSQKEPLGIAVDSASLYWANLTGLTIVKLTPK